MNNIEIVKRSGSYLNSISGEIVKGEYFEARFNGKVRRFNARIGIERVRSEVAQRIAAL